jgi:hypothetical protein
MAITFYKISTVLFTLATGIVYWLILLFVSAMTGLSVPTHVLLLHALFAIIQGSLSFLLLRVLVIRYGMVLTWKISVLYGIWLWIAGSAPLILTDIAARYTAAMPAPIGASITFVKELMLDTVLGACCVAFLHLEELVKEQ